MPLDPDPPFRPLERVDGYLPIEDHGLIGDGTTAALVARDGAVSWLCVPRFDSPALFCSLLDHSRGGAFVVRPEGLVEARQRYLDGSGVLVTELATPDGVVEVTDALTFRRGADLSEGMPCGRSQLVRRVRVVDGHVALRVSIAPRGGAEVERRSGGWQLRAATQPDLDLQVHATVDLDGLESVLSLNAGDRVTLSLDWGGEAHRFRGLEPETAIDATVDAWRGWLTCLDYDGPQRPLVRRSAITLKLLDHMANGAIVAAPTSSLPESIGGQRNWDYRYAWVRDAAFSVHALRRIGMRDEASAFLGWVLDAIERPQRPHVMYDVSGVPDLPEREDPDLEGYRGSRPVRWGNAAVDQHQHDVYGEILDCAFQWQRGGRTLDEHLWDRLCLLVDAAIAEWDTPDHGIWEVRTPGRTFTYSAAMCQVAVDRAVRLANGRRPDEVVREWRRRAEDMREQILERAWDAERETLVEHLDGGELDASLLTLPLRWVVPFDHPKMVATTEAVRRELSAGDGLLFRYLPERSPDGLSGDEGAFLLCSFWLVDNLAGQARLDEAVALYDSLCDRATPLGLLAEQIDPDTGAFVGNFPQAFSHVGVIASGVALARRMQEG